MWQYKQPTDLMHYGKKGMRWGKRSGPNSNHQTIGSKYKKAVEKHEARSKNNGKRKLKLKLNTFEKVAVGVAITRAAPVVAKLGAMALSAAVSKVSRQNPASTLLQIGESFVDYTIN